MQHKKSKERSSILCNRLNAFVRFDKVALSGDVDVDNFLTMALKISMKYEISGYFMNRNDFHEFLITIADIIRKHPLILEYNWLENAWDYYKILKRIERISKGIFVAKNHLMFEKLKMISFSPSKMGFVTQVVDSYFDYQLSIKIVDRIITIIGSKDVDVRHLGNPILKADFFTNSTFEDILFFSKGKNIDKDYYRKWFVLIKDIEYFWPFVCDVIPVIEKRINKKFHELSSEIQFVWYELWQRNIKHEKESILKEIQYLPNIAIRYFLEIHTTDKSILDHLIAGNNIRTYRYHFTKKMAHIFSDFSGRFTNLSQVRFECAILSLTDNNKIFRLLKDINMSFGRREAGYYRLSQLVSKLEGWIKLPFFDKRHFERVFGYIVHGFRDIPNFTLKHTTYKSIIRRSDSYYKELHRIKRQRINDWTGFSIPDFEYIDKNKFIYRIIQLKSNLELNNESLTLNHCVHSYLNQCKSGLISIWSLRDESNTPLVTIELNNNYRIVQIKGSYNRAPDSDEIKIINAWTLKENLKSNFE